MRIKEHPILNFKKNQKIEFTFNGQVMEGYAGEPIAAALHAAGVKVLSHSRNYKRPRGFWCAIGNCSSCNMRVNGVPNVRTCVEPLAAGMVVESQLGMGELGGGSFD